MSSPVGFAAASAASPFQGARVALAPGAVSARRAPPPARTARWAMMADEKGKNPLAGLGGIGNIMEAMKKAQKFTSVAKDLQTELQNTEIETTVREGQVKVILSAQQFPIKVEVSEELVKQGHEEVSAAVTEAFIAAHTKSTQYMKEKMGALTKDFGLPAPPAQ